MNIYKVIRSFRNKEDNQTYLTGSEVILTDERAAELREKNIVGNAVSVPVPVVENAMIKQGDETTEAVTPTVEKAIDKRTKEYRDSLKG